MKKSMIQIARDTLESSKSAMPFLDLWKAVASEMGFNETQFEDNIAQFYTDLSLDGHFVNLEGNAWDLKTRHTFSESVTDTDSIAVDEDEDTEESESLETEDEEDTSEE